MPVAVVGAAAISAYGASWRGLGEALLASTPMRGIPAETPLANPKARNARKMMSRGAYLAAAALGDLMREVGWTAEQREGAGYYLGVGASGGSLDDVTALLDASIVIDHLDEHRPGEPDHIFSLRDFGERGLAACNPLLAFQLMNNFTLAHGAIFEGLGGPNGALFSRGGGTTHALIEAVHAIRSGDCDRAIAGGADSATHPVTHAELAREGFVSRGLVPAEGAAVVALAAGASSVLASNAANAAPTTNASNALNVPPTTKVVTPTVATIDGCAVATWCDRALAPTIADVVERAFAEADASAHGRVPAAAAMSSNADIVVVAGWGPAVTSVALDWGRARFPSATVVDASALGATLAANPALAWVAALDLLSSRPRQRALVIDIGVDDTVSSVVWRAPDIKSGSLEELQR